MERFDDDAAFEVAGEHESVALVRQAMDVIAQARPLPLSSSVRVEPEELLTLLEDALARLPEEIRQARWLLKEREEFLAKVQREGDEILDEARTRAETLVGRQEIVRQARLTAQKTIEDAEAEARRKMREAEDWCDQQLARFEIVLDRTTKTVQAGRERLRSIELATEGSGEPVGDEADAAFFDQDLT